MNGLMFVHVPFVRYHTWMEDVNLRQLTASEPLTLEEEYEMQLCWLNDENSKKKSICTGCPL